MKIISTTIFFGVILMHATVLHAQDGPVDKVFTIDDIFQLAINNSLQLKISEKSTEMASRQTDIERSARLPVMSTGLSYGYLSNADIWTPSFSNHQKGTIPHQAVDFSLEAAQVVFSGNRVNNSILKSTLEEQIALLRQEKNTVDIKFLVAAEYLEIYRLLNQRNVFISNTLLAKHRLDNINSMRRQGMVTQNDILRTELSISDLQLTIRRINNSIAVLNNQLKMILGLPDSVNIIPDSTVLHYAGEYETLGSFLEDAYKRNHELAIAALENKVFETEIKVLKGGRLPELSVFARSNLRRPYYNTLPGADIYFNVYQAGLSLRYNISSIYQSPRRIRAGETALEESQVKGLLQRQNVELAVKNAYIKYAESRDELKTLREDLASAEENYRIVEKKYFNQLSLLTDMIDAANARLEAEIRVTNAEINIAFNHFVLLKETGSL